MSGRPKRNRKPTIKAAATSATKHKKVVHKKKENDGSLELLLPLSTVECWTQMRKGKKITVSAKCITGSKEEDVHIETWKETESICLLFKASKMGSLFQEKLTNTWKCEIHEVAVESQHAELGNDSMIQEDAGDIQEIVRTADECNSEDEAEDTTETWDLGFVSSKLDEENEIKNSSVDVSSLIEKQAENYGEDPSSPKEESADSIAQSEDHMESSENLTLLSDEQSLLADHSDEVDNSQHQDEGVEEDATTPNKRGAKRKRPVSTRKFADKKRGNIRNELSEADKEMLDVISELNASAAVEIFNSTQSPDDTGIKKEEMTIDDLPQWQFVCLFCKTRISMRTKKRENIAVHLRKHLVTYSEYKEILDAPSLGAQLTLIEKYKDLLNERQREYKETHFKNTAKKELLQCPSCKNTIIGISALRCHILKVHKNDSDYLEIVKKVEEKTTKDKSQEYDDIGLLKCSYCDETRSKFVQIKTHCRMVHSNEPDLKERLDDKKKEFDNLQNYFKREKYHATDKYQKQPCRYCGEIYSFRSSRVRHEKYTCPQNDNRQKTYLCTFCDARLLSKEDLLTHKQKHIQDDEKFVCDLCGVIRHTRAGIFEHRRTKHSTIPPKHQCPYCDKAFHQRVLFDKHLTVHSDYRAFSCDTCGKKYKTMAAVKKHEESVHLNKYQFYCKDCGHGVQKRSYLESHICGRVRRNQGTGLTPNYTKKQTPKAKRKDDASIMVIKPVNEVVKSLPKIPMPKLMTSTQQSEQSEIEPAVIQVESSVKSETESQGSADNVQYMMLGDGMQTPAEVSYIQQGENQSQYVPLVHVCPSDGGQENHVDLGYPMEEGRHIVQLPDFSETCEVQIIYTTEEQ